MKAVLPLLTLAGLLTGCATTVEVAPLSEVKDTRNGGFIYSLPKTILVVAVTMKAEIESTGEKEYADHALALFGIEPIQEDKTTLKTGAVTLTPVGRKDPKRTYYAHLKKDPFSTRTSAFAFTPDGVIASGKLTAHNKTLDYVVTTLEAVAKVAATAAAASVREAPDDKGSIPPRVIAAAQRLKALAADRAIILNNASPATGDILARIEAEMNDIASKFFGSVTQAEGPLVFELEPAHLNGQPGGPERTSLFTFKESGEVEFHHRPLGKLPFFVKSVRSVTGGTSVYTTLTSHPEFNEAGLATVVRGSAKKGIHYCLPGRATAKVYKGSAVQAELTTPIAQYGPVAYLPASTGSEKTEISVTLDPVTGALLGVNVDAQAFDPKYIERLGNAANTAAGIP